MPMLVPTRKPVTTSKAKASSSQRTLSPASQRVFSYPTKDQSYNETTFIQLVKKMSRVDNQNVGNKGDTRLMAILRKSMTSDRISQASVLLKHGALWSTSNKKGETAQTLANKHQDQAAIQQLRTIKPS